MLTLARLLLGRRFAGALSLFWNGSPLDFLSRLGRCWQLARQIVCGDTVAAFPVRMQVETTDICNLRCRMCARELLPDMNSRSMPLEEFSGLIEKVEPFYVTLNGLGEPLIDRTIFDKLSLLHDRGIFTTMPTNGTFIRGDKLDRLLENLPSVLQLSIDGARKETFETIRLRSRFDRELENYKALVKARHDGRGRRETKIRILFALQTANLYDFEALYELMLEMPGVTLELVPVFEFDEDGDEMESLVPTRTEVRQLHATLDAAIAAAGGDADRTTFLERWKQVSSRWLDELGHTTETTPGNHACLIPWYSTYVDAKGRVLPCCYLTASDHVMGNIREDRFEAIWNGPRYREFRRRLSTDRSTLDGCRSCRYNHDDLMQRLQRMRPLLLAYRGRSRSP